MKEPCPSISIFLEKYFDRETTNEERLLVEDHLPSCPTCRETLRQMEGLREWIRSPVEEAAQKEDFPWVWQKIEREIQKGEPSWRESLRSRLGLLLPLRKKVWVPAVVTAMILVAVAAPLVFKKTLSSPDPSVVEYVESETCNVMVYESEKGKVTVIWLFEEPEKGTSRS